MGKVIPLRRAPFNKVPTPHHDDCKWVCSGATWLAGPCQVQCVKTRAFSQDCSREAQAHQARFISNLVKPSIVPKE